MTSLPACRRVAWLLGDQLDPHHPWFREPDPDTLFVIAELVEETRYVRHHAQKVVAFFLAMSAFAETLRAAGHRVLHLDLDDTSAHADFESMVRWVLQETGAESLHLQRPDEHRLLSRFQSWEKRFPVPVDIHRTHHFLVPFEDLARRINPERPGRMETFYRRMRRDLGVLMEDDGQPVGQRWNYDQENRGRLPVDVSTPDPLVFTHPASDVIARLERHGVQCLGAMPEQGSRWPVSRAESLALLEHFIRHALTGFGPYQDAMTQRGGALFHSRLSFSLNTKMIHPREVIDAVESAWRDRPDRYPLNSVEGFIRQVLGWREFMRAIYWLRMPDYARTNALDHQGRLPDFYWTGNTRMACLAQAIGQSLDEAWAHHIQRLMITGNFALLAGTHPDEVDAWYLGIYVDAIEWVEMPNTRGMSQFADGGVVASKPYVSSGNYLKKMGDHCQRCPYDVRKRSGPGACPFNVLYWHFMDRHRERFSRNPRIGMVYRNWDRMGDARQQAILETAEGYLADLDAL